MTAKVSLPNPERRTRRRYAHELFPHPAEGEARPLEVDVKYWLARAHGFSPRGTSWLVVSPVEVADRIAVMQDAQHVALLAVALEKGLSGQEAWTFAAERLHSETSEWIGEYALEYGVHLDVIKPYPCGPEPEHHDHLSEPNARGDRFITRVDGKESECHDCTEEAPAGEAADTCAIS